MRETVIFNNKSKIESGAIVNISNKIASGLKSQGFNILVSANPDKKEIIFNGEDLTPKSIGIIISAIKQQGYTEKDFEFMLKQKAA